MHGMEDSDRVAFKLRPRGGGCSAHLPELGANLVAALASLDVDDLTASGAGMSRRAPRETDHMRLEGA